MDPITAALIAEGLKVSVALFLANQKLAGKTEEEAKAALNVELDKALAFDPARDIKDV